MVDDVEDVDDVDDVVVDEASFENRPGLSRATTIATTMTAATEPLMMLSRRWRCRRARRRRGGAVACVRSRHADLGSSWARPVSLRFPVARGRSSAGHEPAHDPGRTPAMTPSSGTARKCPKWAANRKAVLMPTEVTSRVGFFDRFAGLASRSRAGRRSSRSASCSCCWLLQGAIAVAVERALLVVPGRQVPARDQHDDDDHHVPAWSRCCRTARPATTRRRSTSSTRSPTVSPT